MRSRQGHECLGGNLPGRVAGLELHLLARDDCAEPEPLNVEREMPHQSQTGPARWQHRPSQGFLRKALPAKRSDYASGNDLLLSSLADVDSSLLFWTAGSSPSPEQPHLVTGAENHPVDASLCPPLNDRDTRRFAVRSLTQMNVYSGTTRKTGYFEAIGSNASTGSCRSTGMCGRPPGTRST